eukprot:6179311-Pleurochrysis_carterae.AAC.1
MKNRERGRRPQLLKGIRREASRSNNTDELIQSRMQLGKGIENVVIRVFDIINKTGGDGARAQRGIAGVYQDDDNKKLIKPTSQAGGPSMLALAG